MIADRIWIIKERSPERRRIPADQIGNVACPHEVDGTAAGFVNQIDDRKGGSRILVGVAVARAVERQMQNPLSRVLRDVKFEG